MKNQAEVDEEKVTEELKFLNVVLSESMEVLEKTSLNVVNCINQPKLMCQSSFDSFLSMEEEYTTLLTKLANSQFDEVHAVFTIITSYNSRYNINQFQIEYGNNGTKFRTRNVCFPQSWGPQSW